MGLESLLSGWRSKEFNIIWRACHTQGMVGAKSLSRKKISQGESSFQSSMRALKHAWELMTLLAEQFKVNIFKWIYQLYWMK